MLKTGVTIEDAADEMVKNITGPNYHAEDNSHHHTTNVLLAG